MLPYNKALYVPGSLFRDSNSVVVPHLQGVMCLMYQFLYLLSYFVILNPLFNENVTLIYLVFASVMTDLDRARSFYPREDPSFRLNVDLTLFLVILFVWTNRVKTPGCFVLSTE